MVTDPFEVAAVVPSTLIGALAGALLGGPHAFLFGGVLAGAIGALSYRAARSRGPRPS